MPIKYLIAILSLCWLTQAVASKQNDSAVVLIYHHVADDTPAITSTSPAHFEQQLNYLADNGFQVWPLDKIVAATSAGESLPPKTVAISFDDAYLSVYSEAYPRLKKRGWPFTIFVATEQVDKQYNYQLNWQQLREMAANGALIANHSVSHSHLPYQPNGESDESWLARMRGEIIEAQRRIDAELGGPQPKLFAYPYGEHDRRLTSLLDELGYLSFGQQSGPIGPLSDRQAMPRFPIAGNYSEIKDFAVKVNTRALAVEEVEGMDNPLPFGEARPVLKLALKQQAYKPYFQCYGSGIGEISVSWQGDIATVQAHSDLPAGRSRYNCTLPAAAGGFYWYSRDWIRLDKNGEWILD